MARKKKSPDQAKLRTREHVVGDLAVNHFERQALLCGFAVDRGTQDYGIDLRLLTFTDKGEVQPGYVLIQMKGTEKIRFLKDRSAITWRLERSDLMVWRAELLPVILVVYDALADVAYWLHLQDYLARLPRGRLFRANTLTVHIPVTQAVTPDAVRHFAVIRDQASAAHPGGTSR